MVKKRWNFRRWIVASGASVCDRLAWLWVIWVSCQTRLTFCLEFQSRCGLWCYAVSTFDRLSKKIDYWIVADREETRKIAEQNATKFCYLNKAHHLLCFKTKNSIGVYTMILRCILFCDFVWFFLGRRRFNYLFFAEAIIFQSESCSIVQFRLFCPFFTESLWEFLR